MLYSVFVHIPMDLHRLFTGWKHPIALYSAATFLNIGIAYYGSANGNANYNCLILPLRKAAGVHSVNKVIHIY